MKVIMLTSWQEECGIADYAAALVAALRPRVDVEILPLRRERTAPGYFRELGRACNRADLVHIQHEYVFFGRRDPWGYRWPQFIREVRVPYAVTVHTWLKRFTGGPLWKRALRETRSAAYALSGWTRYLESGQFRRAARVIVHTQAHRQALVAGGLPPDRVAVLPQGVPEPRPHGRREEILRRWNLDGKVVVLFGFLNPSKGHLLALSAWEQAQPEATLIIAGKAPSKPDESYARQVAAGAARAGRRVRLAGYLPESELADLLAVSDLVLLPYLAGTSSYALSLALAQGCAVLASDLPQFMEIRSEQPCLELFRGGDASDLAGRMLELLQDSGRRLILQRAAREWAQTHSWESIARKTEQVYSEISASK